MEGGTTPLQLTRPRQYRTTPQSPANTLKNKYMSDAESTQGDTTEQNSTEPNDSTASNTTDLPLHVAKQVQQIEQQGEHLTDHQKEHQLRMNPSASKRLDTVLRQFLLAYMEAHDTVSIHEVQASLWDALLAFEHDFRKALQEANEESTDNPQPAHEKFPTNQAPDAETDPDHDDSDASPGDANSMFH